VACNWRIRHKLVLGLSLVTAIMALLLSGTLYGLASYRAAMSTSERKLQELKFAVNIKSCITSFKKPIPDRAQQARILFTRIPDIEKAIKEYEFNLKETVERGRASNDGKDEIAYVQALRTDIKEIEAVLTNEVEGARVGRPGDLDLLRSKAVSDAIVSIEKDVDDLIGTITNELKDRIESSGKQAQKSIWFLVCTGVSAVLVMTGLLRFFYRWVATPIRDLELGVSRVARGDFQHRIEIHSGDEIEDLAKAYNEMTDKLRAMYENLAQQVNERSRQLVRSERLAGVGFLAAGVAHEINNPLASIAFCSEALESRLAEVLQQSRLGTDDRETIAKYLKMIQEEAFRCKEITQKLLAFSRGGEKSREEVDLAEVVQGVLDMVKHLQNCKGKRIEFHPTGRLAAAVNAQEIKQVFLNLVVNALESMEEDGVLSITHSAHDGFIEFIFTDTGCGMSHDVLENIFEPFFTRSRTGKGTGLGLSISHRIIASHGGEIEASSDGPGKGSTFKVRVPILPPANLAESGQDVQDPVEEFLKLTSAKRAKAA
jgi:two-component system NtrC family sensor kinase